LACKQVKAWLGHKEFGGKNRTKEFGGKNITE
jgi:hypothetical protein